MHSNGNGLKLKRGRKPKSYEEFIEPHLKAVEQWAKEGIVESVICKKLGLGLTRWKELKKVHKQINEALYRGRSGADKEVELALYKKAIGYTYEETHIEKKQGKDMSVKVVRKYAPPDMSAIAFYLKNRMPEVWRDRQDVGIERGEGLDIHVKVGNNEL